MKFNEHLWFWVQKYDFIVKQIEGVRQFSKSPQLRWNGTLNIVGIESKPVRQIAEFTELCGDTREDAVRLEEQHVRQTCKAADLGRENSCDPVRREAEVVHQSGDQSKIATCQQQSQEWRME